MKFVSQVPLTIQPIYTSFGKLKTVYRGPFDWQRMLRLLSTNKERNGLIADHVLADIAGGHTVLVLSRQIRHLEGILKAMQAREKASEDFTLLTGKLSGTHRLAAVQGLRDGRLRCILATQLADEGLDVPRLDRLHLTFPGKHDGRIIQQIGRTIRIHDDKDDAIVYDYVDPKVAVLLRQYDERHSTYRQLGIEIRKAVDYANPQKSKGRAVRDLISLARRGSPARPGRTAERP
jgi:superfamily II DNA or RNA helicase